MTRTALRRGFTMVELIVVVTIMGILVRISLPKLQSFRMKARAAAMISELAVIRGAAYQSYEDKGVWPQDANTGQIPSELTKLLPGGLRFKIDNTTSYDWRLSNMNNGNPAQAQSSTTMGMGVSTSDLALRAEIQRQLAKQPNLVTGGIVYWLIWGPTTKP